jgi:hypothetical protein
LALEAKLRPRISARKGRKAMAMAMAVVVVGGGAPAGNTRGKSART